MKQIEKILFFFLDILREWCNKRTTGSVSILLHFQNGVVKQAFVDKKISVPSEIVKS